MTHRLIGTFTDVAIVPHGWGQVIDGLKSISLSNISNELDRELTISLDTKTMSTVLMQVQDFQCLRNTFVPIPILKISFPDMIN